MQKITFGPSPDSVSSNDGSMIHGVVASPLYVGLKEVGYDCVGSGGRYGPKGVPLVLLTRYEGVTGHIVMVKLLNFTLEDDKGI